MKTKMQIKSVLGDLLFEFEKEDNTIKDTLIEAVKSGANLRYANLVGANLVGANLGGADLGGADLRDANLVGANLVGANLVGADLVGANLGGADLVGANLGGADLGDWGKIESPADIIITGPIGSRNAYTTVFRTDKGIFVQCGCFAGTIEDFAAKVKETHVGKVHERDYNALIEFAKIKFSEYIATL